MTTTVRQAHAFALATDQDDEAVRSLLRRCVIPGAISVAFTRESRYVAGEQLAGAHDRTLVHHRDGVLDAVARLSAQVLHKNGQVASLGYLGELRIAPEATHTARLLRDGFRSLERHGRGEALDGCFTSIALDNSRARRVLEHGRRFGLPAYTPLADLVTLLLPVPVRRTPSARRAPPVDVAELTAFLSAEATAGQLTLTWDAERWQQLARHGVSPSDFRVVRAGGDTGPIVAAGAVWDQRAFKQTVVVGYAGALRWSRPVINAVAATSGLIPSLPEPGTVVPQASILGLCISSAHASGHADRVVLARWQALLRQLQSDAAECGVHWLLLARDLCDPQLPLLSAGAQSAITRITGQRAYHTRLYAVAWPAQHHATSEWDARPFRPEVSLL